MLAVVSSTLGLLLGCILVVVGTVFMVYLMGLELFVLRALSFWDLALTFITLMLLFLLISRAWTRQNSSSTRPR